MTTLKGLGKAAVRKLARNARWGVRQAMLDGLLHHRAEASSVNLRILSMLKVTEIGADGDRGVMTSSRNDRVGLLDYAADGTFAPTITREITNFFGSDAGTFMDVGANIGLTTVPFARNPRIRCLAFEPEPVNFGYLKRNVARNAEGADVQFHQVALFNARGTMSMGIAETNMGDHRLTLEGASGRTTIEVPVVPLDDFLDSIQGPLAIKVDTQGAEPFVIAGGTAVFARAGLIAMEFCPYLMQQLGGDPTIVVDLVAGFDRVAIMNSSGEETLSFMSSAEARSMLEEKLRTAKSTDEDYVDILALRAPLS